MLTAIAATQLYLIIGIGISFPIIILVGYNIKPREVMEVVIGWPVLIAVIVFAQVIAFVLRPIKYIWEII